MGCPLQKAGTSTLAPPGRPALTWVSESLTVHNSASVPKASFSLSKNTVFPYIYYFLAGRIFSIKITDFLSQKDLGLNLDSSSFID